MALYDQALLARARALTGAALAEPTVVGAAVNPLCGDEIEVGASIAEATVRAVGYRAQGCALTSASASILADLVRGRSIADTLALADEFAASLADPRRPLPPGFDVIALVQLLPTRRRCALLPWEALRKALDGKPARQPSA